MVVNIYHEVFSFIAILLVAQYFLERWRRNRMKLPPGPAPYPLIGNLLDMPRGSEWLHWAKLKNVYGPIIYVRTLGQDIVILNDRKSVFDLLEKKSAISSDRPYLKFAADLCAWGGTVALTPSGARLKAMRKSLHQAIGTRAADSNFNSIKEVEASKFLVRLLNGPDRLFRDIRMTVGSIILRIAYGYVTEKQEKDPLIDLVQAAAADFSAATQPGRWFVDAIPALELLPEWLPGTGFKKFAREARKRTLAHTEIPYNFTIRKMATGTAGSSYMSRLIEEGFKDDEDEFIAKWSASSLFAAGSDTSVSALCTFFLAMVLHPEVQRKAQEELDAVVGTDRLPSLVDRENLPYVESVMKETLRWHPVTPLGLPHVTTQDDVYEGYHIPKGTVILANIGEISRDARLYHDPLEFIPERHIGQGGKKPEQDPVEITFGFGRRQCVGKELAISSIFIVIAMTLSVFNINRARDKHGREIEPQVSFSSGLLSHPKQFDYSISARSKKVVDLLKSIEEGILHEANDVANLEGLL